MHFRLRSSAALIFLGAAAFMAVRILAEETGGVPANAGAGLYSSLSPRSGLYKDGRAVWWDLPIFEQFRFFGPPQRAAGYSPEQPVKFSHVTHVANNKMECQYCHWTVSKSPYAAVPEVQACMGCHNVLVGTSAEQQGEIAKIRDYFNEGESIPWIKVHVMPNHVHFNHKRHVKAAVSCQECHGQVPAMQVVERVSSMKMGWCVNCHRERGASIDCYTCHH